MASSDQNAHITWLENQEIDLIEVIRELQTRFMLGIQGATYPMIEEKIQQSIPSEKVSSLSLRVMEIFSRGKSVVNEMEMTSPSLGVLIEKPISKVVCEFYNKEGHQKCNYLRHYRNDEK